MQKPQNDDMNDIPKTNVKRKMLIVLLCVLGALLLLALLVNVLDKYSEGNASETTDLGYISPIKFSDEYITDTDELLSDEIYLGYDRNIYYSDPLTGMTVGIEDGQEGNYGDCVELLCGLLDAIVAGDADSYNGYFSKQYFESGEAQPSFSMQKLYDIKITPYSTETMDDHTEYVYTLEYKICKNNGSLRSDMGSDGIRAQYIIITDREGSVLIDAIYT